MRTKTPVSVNRGRRKKTVMKVPCSSKLYADTYRQLKAYVKAQNTTESEAIRDILDDWFRIKRVQALGKDETTSPVRQIYERVMEEKLQPLVNTVEQLNDRLQGFSGKNSGPESLAQAGEFSTIASDLKEIKATLESTASSLHYDAGEQMGQLEQMEQSQETIRSISCETFAATWSILDFIIRYLVEVDLKDQRKPPAEVEKMVAGERRLLRLEGLKLVAMVEDFLKLPQKMRLAESVHATGNFPLTEFVPDPFDQLF